MYRLSKFFNLLNKQSKRLEIDKRAFAIGDRKQDKSNIQ